MLSSISHCPSISSIGHSPTIPIRSLPLHFLYIPTHPTISMSHYLSIPSTSQHLHDSSFPQSSTPLALHLLYVSLYPTCFTTQPFSSCPSNPPRSPSLTIPPYPIILPCSRSPRHGKMKQQHWWIKWLASSRNTKKNLVRGYFKDSKEYQQAFTIWTGQKAKIKLYGMVNAME